MKRCSLDVSPAFAVFLCAYYYFDPAHTFAPFLTSVTLHEAGHLLLLWLLRVRVRSVRLTLSGAVIETEPLPYWKEILVAAAGPAINGALLILAMHQAPMLALVSLCQLLYNLLRKHISYFQTPRRPIWISPSGSGRNSKALFHNL